VNIEVVRGRSEAIADELVTFWTSNTALGEHDARQRVPEVVCVVRDGSGAIAGVSSVFKAEVELIGSRLFWVYRRFLLPAVDDDVDQRMLALAFDALEAEFHAELEKGGARDDPLGLCVLVADRDYARRHPDAEWPANGLRYAGYLGDGRQVRVRYFEGSALYETPIEYVVEAPGPDVRLELRSDASVSDEDILEMWMRDARLPESEARRRLSEVLAVAIGPDGELTGLCTTYLYAPPALRTDLWHYRVFVASSARMMAVGSGLGSFALTTLKDRFVTGVDTRGRGFAMVLENEGVRQRLRQPHWRIPPFDMFYVGDNALGHPVLIEWFPGASAPAPP
jgi:hypothetical protein